MIKCNGGRPPVDKGDIHLFEKKSQNQKNRKAMRLLDKIILSRGLMVGTHHDNNRVKNAI